MDKTSEGLKRLNGRKWYNYILIKILRKKKATGRELPCWVQVHSMWGPRLITHLLGYNPILCKETKVLLHHKLMIGLEEKIPAKPDHLLGLTQIWAGHVFWVEILISISLHSKLCTLPVSSSGSSQKKHLKTNSSKGVQTDREWMFTWHTSLSGLL